ALPKTFALAMESPPGSKGPTIDRDTRLDCPVSADGSWTCTVPATKLDLVVRAKGFTPQYNWDVAVAPGSVTNFGTMTLRRGASFVAWLDSAVAKTLKGPARAELVRMTMSGSATSGPRMLQPVAEASFSARGMVQLAPVPAGTYTLEVTAPGFAPTRLDQIQIYERSESVLRAPIRLQPPVTIRLTFVPPRDPGGRPWRVEVDRVNELTFSSSSVREGAADENGAFVVEGQGAGRFRVRVGDANGNRYAERELEIQSDADAQRTIEIGLRGIHGTVTIGRKPVAATLFFGGRDGAERLEATADEEGSFAVALPHTGKWRVDVDAPEEGVLAAVDVQVPDKDGELTIELPDSEVAGWVTGVDGKRVSEAEVILATAPGPVIRRTDANGQFRFRGIPVGRANLTATDRKTRESSRTYEIESSHVTNVELVLERQRKLTGTISSQGQPLAGARIVGWILDAGGGRAPSAVSGLEGEFELTFAGHATDVALVVAAAGRTLQAFRAPLTDDPIRLDLAPAGGVLHADFPRDSKQVTIAYNGVNLSLGDLFQWAYAQRGESPVKPGSIEIPSLAPGPYRFCADAVCRDGTLNVGSTLQLNVP
ncbi:MAG: carboxypeptidase regulatory-like domain-containing protein, partial [Acidobacteria bacterium]|nr:carboxypeptidase regulatory-like domain-containing protein [Acidobacteriota bacterium]